MAVWVPVLLVLPMGQGPTLGWRGSLGAPELWTSRLLGQAARGAAGLALYCPVPALTLGLQGPGDGGCGGGLLSGLTQLLVGTGFPAGRLQQEARAHELQAHQLRCDPEAVQGQPAGEGLPGEVGLLAIRQGPRECPGWAGCQRALRSACRVTVGAGRVWAGAARHPVGFQHRALWAPRVREQALVGPSPSDLSGVWTAGPRPGRGLTCCPVMGVV